MTTQLTMRKAKRGDAAALSFYGSNLFAERLPVIFRREGGPSEEEEQEFIEVYREDGANAAQCPLRSGGQSRYCRNAGAISSLMR